jgi:hypothetical protein
MSASVLEKKGEQLMTEAEAHAGSFFNRKAQAISTFEAAAGAFKQNAQYELAAQALVRAGELSELSGKNFEAANFFMEAGVLYRHIHQIPTALRQFIIAVHIAIADTRLGAAGHLYKHVTSTSLPSSSLRSYAPSCKPTG